MDSRWDGSCWEMMRVEMERVGKKKKWRERERGKKPGFIKI